VDKIKELLNKHNRIIPVAVICVCLLLILVIGVANLIKQNVQTQQILDLSREIKAQNVRLDAQNVQLLEHNRHLRQQRETDEKIALQTRNYSRCHAELFVNYTHFLTPINISDFNKCEAIFENKSQRSSSPRTSSPTQTESQSKTKQKSNNSASETPNNPPDPPRRSLPERVFDRLQRLLPSPKNVLGIVRTIFNV